eukprot:TRINITY_DN19065_c0_g1_i1.p1 TRINITY_DN19065_c0_g1~~TRINITY_DN19065_c0_g1_i1.p1  ORF type:complete len:437 (+),score=104.44 TRINITY_DN19065_c0_g1_i1:125-1435(+)
MAAAVAAVKKRNDHLAEIAENQGRLPQKQPAKDTKQDLPDPDQPGIWKYQYPAAKVYVHMRTQIFVAGLIAGNFVMNIIEKWVDPRGTKHPVVWEVFDIFFNVAFFIELVLNMYAFWLCRFWKSGWNIFDFLVVSIGLLGMFKVPLPGPLSLLRMMRAFRVFRLFKRVKSLNKIIVSLGKALPGVANAFFILTLMTSIYAILGVEFFLEFGKEGFYTNELGNVVPLTTNRGLMYGYEYFGNFGKSMYTMFQVLTGESWSEAVARPLLFTTEFSQAFGVAFFFVSFNLLNGVVLINVVIAVLLEKMVDDTPQPSDEEEKEDGEEDEPELGDVAVQDGTVSKELEDSEPKDEKAAATSDAVKKVLDGSSKAATPNSVGSASTQAGEAESASERQFLEDKVMAMERDLPSLKNDLKDIKLQLEALQKAVLEGMMPEPMS